MNVDQKLLMLMSMLNSIIDHDDVPLAEIEAAIASIHSHIDRRMELAKARRDAMPKLSIPDPSPWLTVHK